MNGHDAVLRPEAVERAIESLDWAPTHIKVADTLLARLSGFITHPPLTCEGVPYTLVFPRCRSVHTCFMRYPIDIAFIDKGGSVLVLHRGVGSWCILSHPGAAAVLERASLYSPSDWEWAERLSRAKSALDPAVGFGIVIPPS